MVNSGVIEKHSQAFNHMVDHNMDLYFSQYFPKYAACFSLSQIHQGTLTIGVNDYGEITGIPYIGEIDTASFKKRIEHNMKYIRGNPNLADHKVFKKKYMKGVKIRVVELDTTQKEAYLSDVSRDLLARYNKQKKKYDEEYQRFLQKREVWLRELNVYSCNINTMICKNKKKFYEYVKKHNNEEFANRLMSIVSMEYPITFDHTDTEWRDNRDHFLYWLFDFKDNAIQSLAKKLKPKPPVLPKIYHAPHTLLTQLSDLRYKFVSHNPSLRYYMVQITFPGNIGSAEDEFLQFYNPYRKMWNTRQRAWKNECGPCCWPSDESL
jgi:hypothetical protein